jgi:putative colanic acid biosynthesis acetyltransferase WcaF
MPQTDLSVYNKYPYRSGATILKMILWYYTNTLFFKTGWLPISAFKVFLLRLFGAKVGNNVIIKPYVNIKYPWLLSIANNTWIGEHAWIDNLVMVTIGNNVCISQGAMLQTGSHDYKKTSFDLITGNIIIEDGVWIGCGAIINKGITAGSHSILTSGSIATKNLEPYYIYQGNPAIKVRPRTIN